ncbi:MAG: ABC transporter permease [Candidatus Methanosuratus sp.]|nr:ABC transporter permease [Candidatus Methanosuratincola sp.]
MERHDRVKGLLLGVLSLAVFFFIWQLVAWSLSSPFLPGPYEVLQAFGRISMAGDIDGYTLYSHSLMSIYRVLLGFVFAAVTAIPLGVFMGLKPSVNSISAPIVEPIRFIPPIAWIPLSIILLSGLWRYIFLIWIGAFFPILLNTIAGVKRTSPVLVDMAKTFGADSRTITSRIVLPSALPEVMSGLRVGLGVGWMCIVAAEMMGGDPVGLGRLIIKYGNLLQIDVVIVGMITIGIIGLLLNYGILIAEKRLFRWRVEVEA